MDNRVLPLIILCLVILIGLMTLGSSINPERSFEESIALPEYPVLEINDQPVTNSKVVVDEVQSGEQAWIAIYADEEGMPGRVIGYRRIFPGIFRQLEIEIDLSYATVVLYALVHKDQGNRGIFEFPGIDIPIARDKTAEPQSFRIFYPFPS
jgi:hypothetical protein